MVLEGNDMIVRLCLGMFLDMGARFCEEMTNQSGNELELDHDPVVQGMLR